jgi:Flp pilus assembly protein TadB
MVSAFPIFVMLFVRGINPHYLDPMLNTTGGRVVFGLAAAWAVLGSLLIKRIVEIEV